MQLNLPNVDAAAAAPHQLHRRDAPATSVAAAHAIDPSALEALVIDALKQAPGGLISDEIRALYPWLPYSSITARYARLARLGVIAFAGERPGRSGRRQRVMVLAAPGRPA